jgi:hypothetical protein
MPVGIKNPMEHVKKMRDSQWERLRVFRFHDSRHVSDGDTMFLAFFGLEVQKQQASTSGRTPSPESAQNNRGYALPGGKSHLSRRSTCPLQRSQRLREP